MRSYISNRSLSSSLTRDGHSRRSRPQNDNWAASQRFVNSQEAEKSTCVFNLNETVKFLLTFYIYFLTRYKKPGKNIAAEHPLRTVCTVCLYGQQRATGLGREACSLCASEGGDELNLAMFRWRARHGDAERTTLFLQDMLLIRMYFTYIKQQIGECGRKRTVKTNTGFNSKACVSGLP